MTGSASSDSSRYWDGAPGSGSHADHVRGPPRGVGGVHDWYRQPPGLEYPIRVRHDAAPDRPDHPDDIGAGADDHGVDVGLRRLHRHRRPGSDSAAPGRPRRGRIADQPTQSGAANRPHRRGRAVPTVRQDRPAHQARRDVPTPRSHRRRRPCRYRLGKRSHHTLKQVVGRQLRRSRRHPVVGLSRGVLDRSPGLRAADRHRRRHTTTSTHRAGNKLPRADRRRPNRTRPDPRSPRSSHPRRTKDHGAVTGRTHTARRSTPDTAAPSVKEIPMQNPRPIAPPGAREAAAGSISGPAVGLRGESVRTVPPDCPTGRPPGSGCRRRL